MLLLQCVFIGLAVEEQLLLLLLLWVRTSVLVRLSVEDLLLLVNGALGTVRGLREAGADVPVVGERRRHLGVHKSLEKME